MSWQPTEIEDFSPSLLADEDYRAELRKLLGSSLVLVMRNAGIDANTQVKLTEVFGDVAVSLDRDVAHPDNAGVQLLSRAGTPVDDRDNGYFWHADRSYRPHPAKVTMLHAKLVSDSGGETEFANMHRAYDIAAKNETQLNQLRANHSYTKYHREIEPEFFSAEEIEFWSKKYPDTVQPLVRHNPFSQAPALYLSQLCLTHVEGMGAENSESLLDRLYAVALDEANIYRHKWQPEDLVVWSNVGVMHRATRSTGQRLMHRTVAS